MNTNNYTGSPASENYLRELVFILSARKWLIIFVTLLIFSFVIAVAFLWPPSYTAHAKLMVSRKAVEPSLGTLEKVDYRVEKVSKEDLNSEAQLLLSEDLISRVILQLHEEGSMFSGDATQSRWISDKRRAFPGRTPPLCSKKE